MEDCIMAVPIRSAALLGWSANFGEQIADPAYQIAAPQLAAYSAPLD